MSSGMYRLVHRLDRETSGALVVARTPDAAAWLSACFREHAENAEAALTATAAHGSVTHRGATAASGRKVSRVKARQRQPSAAGTGAAVQRTYWAIVETGSVPGGALPDSGRVVAPIWGGAGFGGDDADSGSVWRPAATAFSVLRQGGGYAWLELRPETGLRQLRRCPEYTSTVTLRLAPGVIAMG